MSIQDLITKIEISIREDSLEPLEQGGFIQDGASQEIDDLRAIRRDAKAWLLEYQQKEAERTGISSLKVRSNNVFGYFIEITKTHAHKAPPEYVRKQTMVNAERFTTPELKEYEEKIFHAEEHLMRLEMEFFEQLREEALHHASEIQKTAHALATLDVLTNFAEISYTNKYVQPEIHEEYTLQIEEGRHPVLEKIEEKAGSSFIPNSVHFDPETSEFLLITGPNMAGKSTYLRQTALIALMAQIGCFVPAKSAKLPMLDTIFTRVGASDNVSKRQSTFMVEMQETAYIVNQATKQSLIILDEVGRGTSTYDGLSLAWAIMEYLHSHIGAKTMFATHYHELIDVADRLPAAKNYSMAVTESSSGIVFLRKIVPGGASESYGIEVAKLAGLPKAILERASMLLKDLEVQHHEKGAKRRGNQDINQLSLFAIPNVEEKIVTITEPHPLRQELKALDVNSLTPLDALKWIAEKKEEL